MDFHGTLSHEGHQLRVGGKVDNLAGSGWIGRFHFLPARAPWIKLGSANVLTDNESSWEIEIERIFPGASKAQRTCQFRVLQGLA
jgi:hypothetical protein